MQVQLKTIYAGPTGVRQPGDTIEVSDAEGQALVDGKYAVAVPDAVPAGVEMEQKPDIETAASSGARETTALPGARRRR